MAGEESISSQITGAVVALLEATGTPTYRVRISGFSKEHTPAYNVFPADLSPSYVAAGEQENTMRLMINCIAFAAEQVDLVIDPLYVAAEKALQKDITLGGLVKSFRLKQWGFKTDPKAEQDVGLLELQYEAEFSTVRGDPATAAA